MKTETLGLCIAISLLTGCGKEEPAAPPEQVEAPTTAPQPGAPQTPRVAQPAQPAAPTAESAVFDRTIAYAQGRIAQKDFNEARSVVSQLESQNLTAAQKSKVEALKRQIPR